MTKYYFYSRISSASQNPMRQQVNFFKTIPEFNPKHLFVDKIPGNIPFLQRPAASELFDIATSNKDERVMIVCDSVDRIGRSLPDCLATISLFTKNGINLKFLKESFETLMENGKENQVAKITIAVMGSIAEMERNRIKERQSEGIAIAIAEGKYKGRKFGSIVPDNRLIEKHSNVVKKLKRGLSVRETAKINNCSPTTVMKIKKILEKHNKDYQYN